MQTHYTSRDTKARVLRFDCFEADLRSGQLRKRGVKIRLRPQSFQVLVSLIQQPGEVVTRSALQRQLWPDEVFVNFEKSLNTAVAQLRAVLGDSADHPRFIETLPKYGYRFIAEVLDTDDSEPPPMVSTVAAPTPRPTSRRWMAGPAMAAVALLVVTLVALNFGGFRNRLLGRTERPRIESLAVLPLANLSGDPEQEYFADGMTDALITELTKISALKKVISRTSVMRYKKTEKTAPQIAAELQVDGLLEGTVEREGDQVRINVQLIDGRGDKHLWAAAYHRELRGVLALQSEVAQAIAQEVRASITPEERTRLAHAQLVNPQAFEAYVKGQHFWETRTRDGLEKSLEYFQAAIAIDPNYAMAYAGLANTYTLLGDSKVLAPADSFPKARAAAQKALELDDNLAEAHAAMALVLNAYVWDWAGCEREISRAIQLNPGYGNAHHWHALFLSQMGRHTEAIAEIKRARELDPLSPRINANVGNLLNVAHQPEQAIQELQKALELNPDDVAAIMFLAGSYSGLGRHEEAIAQIRRGLKLMGQDPESDLGLAGAYALAGKRQEAKRIIERALKARDKKYVPALYLAGAYTILGDKDRAFAWLEKAYEDRDSDLAWLRVGGYDSLRSDPRFTALLRKMKLAP